LLNIIIININIKNNINIVNININNNVQGDFTCRLPSTSAYATFLVSVSSSSSVPFCRVFFVLSLRAVSTLLPSDFWQGSAAVHIT
jgi:hypothetical protein